MAETTLKTRIKLLYKSWSDWQAIQDTFYPLAGEVCLVSIPAGSSEATTAPTVMAKIGTWNGTEGDPSKKSFAQLNWISALGADSYAWSKKSSLEWSDMTDEFKQGIIELVGGEEKNTLYKIVADGTNKWKLQQSEDNGTTWTDVEGSVIDLSSTITAINAAIATEKERAEGAEGTITSDLAAEVVRAKAEENKKPDKEITSANGTAMLWNEASGGGAKFNHIDGSESFVGVNSDGKTGMMAQIYADVSEDGAWVGSRINIYHNGIYYVSKANQKAGYAKNAAEMEIATKKDIQDLGSVLHFVGIAEKQTGETEAEAVERTFPIAEQTAGAVAICGNKEFVAAGSPLEWKEFGDVSAYATKAELQTEATTRATEDATLQANINTEANTRATADETLQTNINTEASSRQTADTTLQQNINAEAQAREQADTTLQTNLDTETSAREAADSALDERLKKFELPAEPEVKTIGNYNYFFANGVSVRIEDNATENIAYYCTAEGVQKSITFPYQSIVHGGGLGTSTKSADINSTLVIMNSGKVKNIYGGSRDYGNVGVATIVVNGGTLQEGAIGGGAAGSAGMVNSVGLANITLNGGSSLMDYGGGMGLATVGKVNMLINGGTHQWITAGGANGTTGSANVEITGGTITCVQAVNRGTIQDATITISGGTITNVYGGGETGDSSVTGKCEKTIFHIEKAFGGHLNKGTYNGVEDASRVTGDYVETTITTAEATACNLTVRKYPGLADIAYSGNVNDLIQSSGDVLILNCNF